MLKPSEQVPLTQQITYEVLDGLGLPPGVVNLVNGSREVVEAILDHPGIDAVSFAGSAPVAKLVYERAAKAGKRVQALGGANQWRTGASRRDARLCGASRCPGCPSTSGSSRCSVPPTR